jgi:hypothetical protein
LRWLEIRASVRAYVYPPLTNFYFRLALKPFSAWKVTIRSNSRVAG